MASHLTVISGTTGASASAKAFAGQQSSAQDGTTEAGGLLGLFAALLNSIGSDTVAADLPKGLSPDKPGNSTGEGLAGLFRMTLEGEVSADTEGDTENPEALAAVIDAPVQLVTPVDPKPMVNFIEALGALKTSLDQGEPLDPELLAEVNSTLTDLDDALGLDIETLPVPEDFAALLETTSADETGLAGALTQLLAPLAESIATAQPATDVDAIADAPEASAQLKALGDKLAALLGALEEGDVPAEKLAALGMAQDQPLDPEIEAALSRFVSAQTSLQTADVPEEPALAMPALKLTEPVLAGTAAETAKIPEKTADTSSSQALAAPEEQIETAADPDQDQTDNQNLSDRGRDRPEPVARESRGAANAFAPAATDASNNPAPSAEAAAPQQAVGARVDASANPRIIQAGYQTSQQQLNLPQIAFELGRQVQDGNSRFQIRLDPPELGRIDVRLDINDTGQVNARLTVEKAETLDLMQRDQRGLERALQQAGLDSSKTNLEFSLKQNPFAGQQGQMGDGKGQSGNQGNASANDTAAAASQSEETPPMVNLYRVGLQASGVNIIA